MNDTIRKRREQRARYAAALASWRALDEARHCRACHDIGAIRHEEGELPCPYCRPDRAREAARGATA
jgi:nitrate/TMAO reductase-like tetraheme cytochrome c subunit